MRYPCRADVYRRTAAAGANRRGSNAPLQWTLVAANVPCDVQRERGGTEREPYGGTHQGRWKGFLRAVAAFQPKDRLHLRTTTRDRMDVPRLFDLDDVYAIGGRWDTEATLLISGDATPVHGAPA